MCVLFQGLSDREGLLKLNENAVEKIPVQPADKDLDPIAQPHMDPGAVPDDLAAPKNPNLAIIPKPPIKVRTFLNEFVHPV